MTAGGVDPRLSSQEDHRVEVFVQSGGINRVVWREASPTRRSELLRRPALAARAELDERVREIVAGVREEGDPAVRRWSRLLDRVELDDLEVPAAARRRALETLDGRVRDALLRARQQLEAFHRPQLVAPLDLEVSPGVRCRRELRPLDSVGLYVPGGSAPLPSTLLMLGVPAAIAGCPLRVVCTPPRVDGSVDSTILAAAELVGVERIFRVGGAQAVAALAYGTDSVPRVCKIFGPGNVWVTRAKALCAQDPAGAAIDMPAGPSEVLVIADANADAELVAADLLSQAEHGPDAQVVLVATDPGLVDAALRAVERQVAPLPRAEIARASLTHAAFIEVETVDEALAIANEYAPEHLILQVAGAPGYAGRVRNAGSVFLGAWTPESAGDYASGTNHVLPTFGWARSVGGLSVTDFCKPITFQELTREGLADLAPVVETLAGVEGLAAHAAAVRLRRERIGEEPA